MPSQRKRESDNKDKLFFPYDLKTRWLSKNRMVEIVAGRQMEENRLKYPTKLLVLGLSGANELPAWLGRSLYGQWELSRRRQVDKWLERVNDIRALSVEAADNYKDERSKETSDHLRWIVC